MPKPAIGPQRRTGPLIWGAAVICAIVAVGVIIFGIIVVVSFVVIHPKTPTISISYANLNKLYYDQMGNLEVELSIVIKAKNDNVKTQARFYDIGLIAGFHGMEIAKLVNDPFVVGRNKSEEFKYLVESRPIPLRSLQKNYVQSSFRKQLIEFELKGKAKTRWRVWGVGWVKFALNLDCELQFFVLNGSVTPHSQSHYCSSKSS